MSWDELEVISEDIDKVTCLLETTIRRTLGNPKESLRFSKTFYLKSIKICLLFC